MTVLISRQSLRQLFGSLAMCCTNRSAHRGLHCLVLALLSLVALSSAGAYGQKSTAPYTVIDLGGLPGLSYTQSQAIAINDAGEIVGASSTAGPNGSVTHAVVWAQDATGKYVITDLGIPGSATGINSQGDVVAGGYLVRPVTVNGMMVWYQDLNSDGINDLAIPISVGGHAISDNLQIVSGQDLVQFDAAGNEIITTLPGEGYALNDYDEVAGEDFGQATIWQVDATGKVLATETLSPLPGNTNGSALCIDALGRAAGFSYHSISPISILERATLWQSGTNPTDLGAPPGSGSAAFGMKTVNGVLEVVGHVDTRSGDTAFLWKNGVMTDLNKLISASGVSLQQATAINSHGQIVANAYVTLSKQNTEYHAFLLTPK